MLQWIWVLAKEKGLRDSLEFDLFITTYNLQKHSPTSFNYIWHQQTSRLLQYLGLIETQYNIMVEDHLACLGRTYVKIMSARRRGPVMRPKDIHL